MVEPYKYRWFAKYCCKNDTSLSIEIFLLEICSWVQIEKCFIFLFEIAKILPNNIDVLILIMYFYGTEHNDSIETVSVTSKWSKDLPFVIGLGITLTLLLACSNSLTIQE